MFVFARKQGNQNNVQQDIISNSIKRKGQFYYVTDRFQK